MPMFKVELKVRMLVEGESLTEAIEEVVEFARLHTIFNVEGTATEVRSRPKWWGSRSAIPVEEIRKVNDERGEKK